MNLDDHAVRKYDYAVGRFTTPDALWENKVGRHASLPLQLKILR